MPSEPADESKHSIPAISMSRNPYAVTSVGTVEAMGDAWPYELPLAKSRRVRRLARDADRAPLSIVGAVFLGFVGPIVFTIFFTGHLWSYHRLIRQYPDLLNPEHQDQPTASSFAAARGKFVAWACLYGTLLAIEFVWLASLFIA